MENLLELNEAIQFFLINYFQKRQLSVRTYQGYKEELDKFYHFLQLNETTNLIGSIDEEIIGEYLNERGKILTLPKLTAVASRLKRFFYFLKQQGIIEHDPAFYLKDTPAKTVIKSEQLTEWENTLSGLTNSLKKLGKEQYKFQAVIESKGEKEWELFNELKRRLHRSERLLEDVIESKKELTSNFIKELLPVVDGLEEAIVSLNTQPENDHPKGLFKKFLLKSSSAPNLNQFNEGLILIRDRLMQILQKADVTAIESLGKKFNPHEHVAVAVEPDADVEQNTIVKEHLKGYRQGDEVIRLAEVVVVKN